MSFALRPALALSPFAAFVDPSAALEAHLRLAVALAERCVRWSPLDKPSIHPLREASEVVEDAAPDGRAEEPLDVGTRLWP